MKSNFLLFNYRPIFLAFFLMLVSTSIFSQKDGEDFGVYKTYEDFVAGKLEKLGTDARVIMLDAYNFAVKYVDNEGKHQKYKCKKSTDWGFMVGNQLNRIREGYNFQVLNEGRYICYGRGVVEYEQKKDGTITISTERGFYFSDGLNGQLTSCNWSTMSKTFPDTDEKIIYDMKVNGYTFNYLDFLNELNQKKK